MPFDDLVAAPEEGDPRLRLKPGRVKGRTVIPLTRQPDGMQAWKIIIPTSNATPEPRTHDGDEWIYVLSGHMISAGMMPTTNSAFHPKFGTRK